MDRQLYEDIDNICKRVAQGHQLREDLTSEVYLLIVTKVEDYKQLYESERSYLLAYSRGIAYNYFNNSYSYFYRKYRAKGFKNVELWRNIPTKEDYNFFKDYNLGELSEINQLWIKEFVKVNCSVSKFRDVTNISQDSIKKKLKSIYKQIRQHND